jgi:ring-1,2-phenylacetyl-CoA epoxidase subunit PaaC
MDDENVYTALSEADTDARWAYGTGFDDPMAGVDSTVPDGVDHADLAVYCQMLGDDALILAQRLIEWTANAPELEEEVALANIALDLLGQARWLLGRAGQAEGAGRDEDALAFLRAEHEFRNVRLVEAPNGDFAEMIVRLLAFATWRLALFERLTGSRDPVLAAIAVNGVKELTYHRDYAAQWTVRLGDGTDFSHARMEAGLAAVEPLVEELFAAHDVERRLVADGVAVDPSGLRPGFDAVRDEVLAAATLARPEVAGLAGVSGRAGRDGVHTEEMGRLLAEMQCVARAHPGATW